MKDIFDCAVLVVDDESEILSMVAEILRRKGYRRVLMSADCQQARATFEKERPDAVILDVLLPDGDGFDLMRAFRAASEVPVLFLSARDEDENRLLGLGLGADDYIAKPFLPQELTLRLAAVLRRAYFPAARLQERKPVFSLGETEINFEAGVVTTGNSRQTLTAKEYAILYKLYENRGGIVTLDALCRAAWNDRLYGYENTLMVHIRRLREKIESDPSHPRYLLTVRGLGYRLEKEGGT